MNIGHSWRALLWRHLAQAEKTGFIKTCQAIIKVTIKARSQLCRSSLQIHQCGVVFVCRGGCGWRCERHEAELDPGPSHESRLDEFWHTRESITRLIAIAMRVRESWISQLLPSLTPIENLQSTLCAQHLKISTLLVLSPNSMGSRWN